MLISQKEFRSRDYKAYESTTTVNERYAIEKKRRTHNKSSTSRDMNQERIEKENNQLLKKIKLIIENKDCKNKNDIRDIF